MTDDTSANPTPDSQTPPDLHKLPTDTERGLLLIVSGPSGVGKTTITRAIERSIASSVFSVSMTTRDQTPADVDGVDYHFVPEDKFVEMIESGGFLEHANVFGKRYGTPAAWVDEQLRRGRLVILEIDVAGAMQVKQAKPDAFALFIVPPSEETLLERLRSRKRESEDAIQRRFAEAKREIAAARGSDIYDSFVTNDHLDRAIEEAVTLVKQHTPS